MNLRDLVKANNILKSKGINHLVEYINFDALYYKKHEEEYFKGYYFKNESFDRKEIETFYRYVRYHYGDR